MGESMFKLQIWILAAVLNAVGQAAAQQPPEPPLPPTPAVGAGVAGGIGVPAPARAPSFGVPPVPPEPPAFLAQARGKLFRVHEAGDDQLYERGQRALDRRAWDEALESFSEVAARGGPRADGASYWKAYALNKLGRRDEALAAIEQLRKSYAGSRWLDDAKALEVEVRQASGRPVTPESETNEELKLIAISGLVNSDPERAVPLLEKLLKQSTSPKLKERALFVLVQSGSPRALEVVTRIARGGSNPDVQMKALQYVGMTGSKESRPVLSEIYNSSNDLNVKRTILRSFMTGGEHDKLFAAAKGEKSPELRREAIHLLGMMGARRSGDSLASMYASETDSGVRKEIVNALFMQQNAKALVDIARKTTDPELKKDIVQKLSYMKSKEAADYLMDLLNK
jgi:HEAT repeat protein